MSNPKEKKLVDTKIGDVAPTKIEERKAYVAQVAGFHTDILEKKLNQMIVACHILLEEPENSSETDLALKGTIYSFRELIRWGKSMVNEQISYNNKDN